MRKLKIIAALIWIPLIAVALALPWYLGGRAEQAMRTEAQAQPLLRGSPFVFKVTDYDRGWFKSMAVHRVSVKGAPELVFDVEHEIRHIPDPRKGWVQVRSTPRLQGDMQRMLDYFFGTEPALVAQSVVAFDGQVHTTFSSPAFSKPLPAAPAAKVQWGGATGSLVQGDGGKVRLSARMPALDALWDAGSAKVRDIGIDGEWTAGRTETEWAGETKLSLAEVEMKGPGTSASLKGLETSVVQRNNGNTVLFGYNLIVREGAASKNGSAPQAFTNAVLQVELDGLDKKALAKYFDGLARADRAQLNGDAYQQAVLQLALGLMGDLMQGSPTLRVKQVGVKTAQGALSGQGSARLEGKGAQPTVSPVEMMQRLTFEASVQISDPLLRSLLVDHARQQASEAMRAARTPVDPAQLDALSANLVAQQIHALGEAGLLKSTGEGYQVQAQFSQGRLLINGMPGDQLLAPLFAPKPSVPDEEA